MNDSLNSHLECNICHELPKGILIYSCSQGHDICRLCFDRLVPSAGEPPRSRRRKVCPHGRCPYAKPPFRNRTVENILADVVMSCEQGANGCGFSGNWAVVKEHQERCRFKPVDCIEDKCEEKLPMSELAVHLRVVHKLNQTKAAGGAAMKWLAKPKGHLQDRDEDALWRVILRLKGQDAGLIWMATRDRMCYFWITLFEEEEDAEKYLSRVTVRHRDNVTKVLLRGQVSVRQGREAQGGRTLSDASQERRHPVRS